jgi:hypothetical protein
MRRKLFLFLTGCAALLYALPATASPNPSEGEDLKGRWEVTQITVEKNTGGKKETAVYKSASEVKSYYSAPQEWEIKDAETLVLRYPDGREENCKYALEGDRLKVDLQIAMLSYQFIMSQETMTLRITHNYVNNPSAGRTEQIEENWTTVLRKKQ